MKAECQTTRYLSPRLQQLVAACVVWVTCPGCEAQPIAEESYPSRPIKLIVPFSAGGGTDTFARVFKAAMDRHEILPHPVVVVNLGGAGATIGSRRVKDAVPDGYTILILHEAIITAKYAGKVNYGPEAFQPIAQTGEIGTVIAVAEDSEYGDLGDLMKAAADNPEEVPFAANLGAPSHFAGLLLEKQMPGAAFRYSQYGGGSDRFAAIKGGHVAASAFSLAEYVGFKDAGLRAVAFMGSARHPRIPEVKTALEQDFNVVSYNVMMWWAPKGTPRARIEVLAAALKETMETPEVQQRLAELQYESTFATGNDLEHLVQELTEEVAQVKPRKPVGLPDIPLIIGTLAGITAVVSAFQAWKSPPSLQDASDGGMRPEISLRLVVVTLSLIAYVATLSTEILHFAPATFAFAACVTTVMIPRNTGWAAVVVTIALILSFGIDAIFSGFFQVMLP